MTNHDEITFCGQSSQTSISEITPKESFQKKEWETQKGIHRLNLSDIINHNDVDDQH